MDPTVISIPEERVVDGKSFPLTLDYSDHSLEEICTWVAANKEKLDDLLRDHRGILLRCGSQADSYQAFHDIVDSTGLETMEYIGGAAVRTQLTPRVFTANESPASEQIPFHHELAQTPEPPTHVLFFCEVPPTSDGETPILVSSEVYDRMNTLHPQFMSAIEARGLKYVRVMPEHDDPSSAIGRGWRATFNASDTETAEAALRKIGSSWAWLPDGSLRTVTATVPAIRTDDQPAGVRRSQRKTFFNSMVAAYTGWNDERNEGKRAVILGSDSSGAGSGNDAEGAIDPARLLDGMAMADAVKIMEEVCVAFRWQAGDVLLLDNRTVMHSRRPFQGSRRILASLVRDPSR
ncbi:syringomycin biosynthesis enzyme [Ochromonadaceae sp. CCMP2298]|nr:syringomycin biosynthesis enzyme [Ochromonadaceae sp. CCMP2298]|mmetsp:Transcript_26422/g.59291  ORF Transcript_26422/g.59291 Transcript_26422/m.59291 type:complete len:349 (-) Transcript_26422:523-1569(-)